MPDLDSNDIFDNPPPEDAGELVEERSDRNPHYRFNPDTGVMEARYNIGVGSIRLGDDLDGPFIFTKIQVKEYILYAKIKFQAWTINRVKDPFPVDHLELIMDTGQGSFKKAKDNVDYIQFTEEKYATFNISGGRISLRVKATFQGHVFEVSHVF